MKNLLIVMKYTIKEAVSKKVFRITNIIMCALIILICNIPNIINTFDIQTTEEKEKVIVVDKENVLGENINMLSTLSTDYEFIIDNNLTQEQINEKVNSEDAQGAILLKNVDNNIAFDYIIKENDAFSSNDIKAENFSGLIKSIEVSNRFKELNIPEDVLIEMNNPISYELKTLATEDEGNNNFGIAMAASFILFFAVYFYGYSVSASVSSEKTSRVMETLVTSTTPANIILGKTLGMGIVGLAQLVGLILVGAISYNTFVPENFDILNNMFSSIDLSVTSIVICIVYFILGYIVYAFLNAVTGATVSKAEDVQSANTPISLISLLSFYLAYFTATVPNSAASKFASIFPFSAAFSMPGRILAGGVNSGEIIASVVILLITAAILAFISIKVYSAAILHYGNRLKMKDLVDMFKQK